MSISHRNSPPSYYLPEVDRTEVKSYDSRRRISEVNPLPREVSGGDSIVTKQLPYQAAGRAQQTISEKIRADGDISHVKYTHSESSTPVTKPLLVECDDCMGCGQITHDHPNDPWATVWTCSMCDGTGEVIAGCDCCRDDAVEVVDGTYMCEAHAAEARADALIGAAP